MVFGLNQTHGFTRMIVKMIVALFKEKKAFSLLKATIIPTIILVKPCIWLRPNTDFHVSGKCLYLLGRGLLESDSACPEAVFCVLRMVAWQSAWSKKKSVRFCFAEPLRLQ